MFYQEVHAEQRLITVNISKMNEQIMKADVFDHKMSVHLAGANDLITAEGRYRLTCYIPFMRSGIKKSEGIKITDTAMLSLENEFQ